MKEYASRLRRYSLGLIRVQDRFRKRCFVWFILSFFDKQEFSRVRTSYSAIPSDMNCFFKIIRRSIEELFTIIFGFYTDGLFHVRGGAFPLANRMGPMGFRFFAQRHIVRPWSIQSRYCEFQQNLSSPRLS